MGCAPVALGGAGESLGRVTVVVVVPFDGSLAGLSLPPHAAARSKKAMVVGSAIFIRA
jgi:hypothetical protein